MLRFKTRHYQSFHTVFENSATREWILEMTVLCAGTNLIKQRGQASPVNLTSRTPLGNFTAINQSANHPCSKTSVSYMIVEMYYGNKSA
jgi:hypothetical protein